MQKKREETESNAKKVWDTFGRNHLGWLQLGCIKVTKPYLVKLMEMGAFIPVNGTVPILVLNLFNLLFTSSEWPTIAWIHFLMEGFRGYATIASDEIITKWRYRGVVVFVNIPFVSNCING